MLPGASALTLALLLTPQVAAYETDPLTARATPPEDILQAANAEVDRLLELAVAQTNRRTRCRRDPQRTREVLAYRIFRVTARQVIAPKRRPLQRFGHGRYGSWLETEAPAQLGFPQRGDLFGELPLLKAPILSAMGPCSTVCIGGVVMGTDKLHHFFSLGHDYALRSRWGEDPERAIRYGHRTELFPFGLWTSQVYSFADLRANLAGYHFYVTLLEEGSPLGVDEEGCVVQREGWDWSEHVDAEFDELANPSVFVPALQESVDEVVGRDAERLCEGWASWGPPLLAAREAVAAAPRPYVVDAAPEQGDPFQLAEVCGPIEE